MTVTSIPKGAIRRCEIQGRNDIREKGLNNGVEMTPKCNIFTGRSLPCLQYCRGIWDCSMGIVPLKIAPKHDTKNIYLSTLAVTAEMDGFFLRRTYAENVKKKKKELAFFLNDRGRRSYNELCRKCQNDCKQSFRATIIDCPRYLSKRAKGGRKNNEL